MPDVTPDPKPRKRLVLSNVKYLAMVRTMLERHPLCELCGLRRSESFHHTVPRGQGGDDVEANGAMLCGSGTTLCHGSVETSAEARARLRLRMRPETIFYAIGRKGEAWFDRRYPEMREAV